MKSKIGYFFSVFVLIAFLSGNLNGQAKFEKTFQKETETDSSKIKVSAKFKNVTKLSYYPDTLPNWFFTPPQNTVDCIYAIGISDPDMKPAKAKALAIHRAKAMAGLYIKSKLQYYRDVYTSNQEAGRYTNYRQRFETYFKVSSMGKVDDAAFTVLDSHITRYNESMILIKYTPKSFESSGNNLFSVTGSVLYIEAQVGDAFEVQAEYEFQTKARLTDNKYQSAHYLYREKGNKFLSNSEFLGSPLVFPVYIYKYASPNWKDNTPPLTSYNGIWSTYTREFLRRITLNTEQTKIRIQNMGQKSNPEMANLSRETASYFAQIKLNGIVFERDSIKLDLKINEVTSPSK